jgi:hypothetical protein
MLISGCSPKAKKADLPNYSDMSAAADAGLIVTEEN